MVSLMTLWDWFMRSVFWVKIVKLMLVSVSKGNKYFSSSVSLIVPIDTNNFVILTDIRYIDMKIIDQIDIISKNTCFINLKDHEKNFQNILLVRLINPAKDELARISNWPEIHLLKVNKVNNKNTRKMCKICSKLTIKTPEERWCLYY